MRLSTLRLCCFSPTGTTLRVARALGESLAARLSLPLIETNFTTVAARAQPLRFKADELVIFGTPVYAGRVPNLLLPFLKQTQGCGALVVPLVLYGNRAYDDALLELRLLLEDCGCPCLGGAAFIGEHSFGRKLAANRPDALDLQEATRFAAALCEKLAGLDEAAPLPPLSLPGENPIRPYYRPLDGKGSHIDIRRVKPETTEACVHCGSCVTHCPMGAIASEDPHAVPGICIKCNACVKGCPQEAKHFTDAGYLFHRDDITARFSTPRREVEWYL